ncbi:MAG TPA: nucleoside triphosphate pyrophosphohydrolase [Steroidobacteraceae bacterium]|nr:nucleoside triphosphate pyrophosphohydrolase [Steroidobacteraceae bacterium]
MPIDRLLEIMRRLRDPQHGCPWDREQTWATIVPHTLEEAYELAEAVARGEPAEVRDELGDLLFQVVFQARIAEERGLFDFDAVVDAISEKLERRHPHVFGTERVSSIKEQTQAWEGHKAAERRARGAAGGALEGVTLALPALTRAAKLGARAARVGFDWPDVPGVLAKVEEEVGELRGALAAGSVEHAREEFGDLLFALTQAARHLKIDPEGALREASAKFERRFRRMEERLAETGEAMTSQSAEALDALWNAAKRDVG